MKKLVTVVAAGALIGGSMLAMSMMANAGVQAPSSSSFDAALKGTSSIAQPAACNGHTGWHGCGPGWYFRHGWKGWACYRC